MSKTKSRTCRDKTATGNVYGSYLSAVHAATKLSLHRGIDVRAYKCTVCQYWHIGGDKWRRIREHHMAKSLQRLP